MTDTTRKPSRRKFLKSASATTLAAAGTATLGTKAFAKPPFFKLYLMIPNNQPARMIWGTLAAQQMAKLGIDVISSFQPFTVISPRRNKGDGKTHPEGGWDAYLERYYYSTITPTPNSLFLSSLVPPNGQNFYFVSDPVIDDALKVYASTTDAAARSTAIKTFAKRWYDTEPMTILFYPEDVIAVNPKLTGYNGTTYNPVFYPRPENWTIEGRTSAAFASWPQPTSLIPMYTIGYHESNVFGPVHDRLLDYADWESKKIVPSLATEVPQSADGKTWVIKLRPGVKWHSGEEFTAADVKFTWDSILNKAYTTAYNANFTEIFGSPNAYKVTGKHEITVTLPKPSILFVDFVLAATAILPEHAYKDIKPESLRGHTASTWLGSYTVKTSDGKSYTAKGAIGTGPWICQGYDPAKKAYRYSRNEAYWKPHKGNIKDFFVVNIQGSDSVLSALKSGEIDAHDPMYDIGTLAGTVDKSWGKVVAYDSFKWQHICYNLRHPVFGTGVDTPLGKKEPARAAEAAAYIRKAISHAMPREQIVKEIVAGFGKEGTVPIPFTAPEYDKEILKPIAYDMDIARKFMEKAGYEY